MQSASLFGLYTDLFLQINSMLRRKMYSIHRTLSLIIAIPVLIWASSGFMHPLMTNIRPKIATQTLTPVAVDQSRISVSLKDALLKNGISQIHSFRFVHIDSNWFYQVQLTPGSVPLYISTQSGKKLTSGDELYAKYLAVQFLDGQRSYAFQSKQEEIKDSTRKEEIHDCCDAAKSCVLQSLSKTKVKQIELLKAFDDEYKYINRLLPIYKVSFDRGDGIRVYVETTSDRFSYAVDNKRALFDNIFSLLHNWSWMDGAGNYKYLIMVLLLTLAMLTTILGIYIFFVTRSKKNNGNRLLKARKNHRWSAIVVSLFTLMFAFSGAFHAMDKMKTDDRYQYFVSQKIDVQKLPLDLLRLEKSVRKKIYNVNVIQLNGNHYWQVCAGSMNDTSYSNKGRRADMFEVFYVDVSDYSLLYDGEIKHANYLALQFSKNDSSQISSAVKISKFDGEYGFVNKRLPVWKVGFKNNDNERYYVETGTGRLSVRIDDKDLYEGYSFAFLHKHHFMDFAGKIVRDISTMFWAMGQVVMVMLGFILWRRSRRI